MIAAEPGERLRGAFHTGAIRPWPRFWISRDCWPRHSRRGSIRQTVRPWRPNTIAVHDTAERGCRFQQAGEFRGRRPGIRPGPGCRAGDRPGSSRAPGRCPGSEALALGVTSYRDTLLPLFSLRGLLGLPAAPVLEDTAKIVVVMVRGALVGLVVDRMRAIMPADPDLIEPTPSALAARIGGEARIRAIYRARRAAADLDPGARNAVPGGDHGASDAGTRRGSGRGRHRRSTATARR